MTALSSGPKPRVVWNGAQGLSASFSAKQNVNFAGVPWVARSPCPGVAPPMLICTSRSARPRVALVSKAGPKRPIPACAPISRAIGPLSSISTVFGWVVALTPLMLNSGRPMPCTAAASAGNMRGSQPAITAQTAAACTVASPWRGAITPSTSSGSRPQYSSIASTRSAVGAITGRPSDQLRRANSRRSACASAGASISVPSRPGAPAPDAAAAPFALASLAAARGFVKASMTRPAASCAFAVIAEAGSPPIGCGTTT